VSLEQGRIVIANGDSANGIKDVGMNYALKETFPMRNIERSSE